MERWNSLEKAQKDALASKYGLTRSGLENDLVSPDELLKVPEGVLPELPKPKPKKVKKVEDVDALEEVKVKKVSKKKVKK